MNGRDHSTGHESVTPQSLPLVPQLLPVVDVLHFCRSTLYHRLFAWGLTSDPPHPKLLAERGTGTETGTEGACKATGTLHYATLHYTALHCTALHYYRSRIKCLLFVPKTQTPRVTSKSPHTILKKLKIWGTFLFLIFSMVRAPFLTMPHTRLSWILGMKGRHFILLQ